MTKIGTFFSGIYPRSNKLAQATRDVGRKRQTQADLETQLKKDFDSLIKLQKSLDFDFFEDGKLTWQDIFRPIVEGIESGVEVGALTRWFDNNSFYRQPIFTRPSLKINEKKLGPFFHEIEHRQKWKVTLPSPFSFAKLSAGLKDLEERLEVTTKLIGDLLLYLEKQGVVMVWLNEPSASYYDLTKQELKLFTRSLNKLFKAKKTSKLGIQFHFGDNSKVISEISDTRVADVLGIDFYRTPLESLPKKFNYDLAAGVLEARNSLIEDEKEIIKFAEKLTKKIQPGSLYLTNNSDLDLLPEVVARQKLELLGRVKKYFN